MAYDYLLFDLDGTISDPIEGISKSVNYALQKNGYPDISQIGVAKLIGPPLNQTFKVMANTEDEREVKKLIKSYRDRFGELGYKENVLYPDVKEILNDLSQTRTLVLCTSKITRFADKILEHFGIADLFKYSSGGDHVKNKGQQIEKLLSDGVITQNAIMIGDRDVDLIAGQKNGIDTAGVLWGYGPREELEKESPQYIFDNVTDLLELQN